MTRRSTTVLVGVALALSVVSVSVVPARAQGATAASTGAFDAATVASLEAALDTGFARSGAAGATLGLWVPGRGSWVATRGVADRSRAEPMSRLTQAPIGSVTKTFTVLVALQLVTEGQLSLDATIDQWYPNYPEASAISIRMLMNHSSGVADISTIQLGIKCADPSATTDPDTLIELSATQPRAPFAPGHGSSYSSANTIILGRILEKITGSSYRTLLQERLFDPLGMARTRLDDDGALQSPLSHGYTDFCVPTMPAGTDTSTWPVISFAGGALASTIDDLHTYGIAFGEGFGLNDELKRARIQDTAPTDDTSGLGLVIERDPSSGALVSLGHAGSVPGYGTNLLYYPCSGAVFAAMVTADFDPALIDILTTVQPIAQQLAVDGCAPVPVTTPVTTPTTTSTTVSAAAAMPATPRFTG